MLNRRRWIPLMLLVGSLSSCSKIEGTYVSTKNPSVSWVLAPKGECQRLEGGTGLAGTYTIDDGHITIILQAQGIVLTGTVRDGQLTLQEPGFLGGSLTEIYTRDGKERSAATSSEESPGDGRRIEIRDELNGSTIGVASGIDWSEAIDGQGAVFRRSRESRIQYPHGIPEQGTLEWWIRVDSSYRYSDFRLYENDQPALIFTTDVEGGDVTWPGSTFFYVARDGALSLRIATAKYDRPQASPLVAKGTVFRFGDWHAIGISFGSEGEYIMLDGTVVAADATKTQSLGRGGTQERPIDVPTVGESVSAMWQNNQHEGGFEGVVDRFRASPNQRDWRLAAWNVTSSLKRTWILRKLLGP